MVSPYSLIVEHSPASTCVTPDSGYTSEKRRAKVLEQGAKPNIPRRENSKKDDTDMDWGFYKYRHLVENAFARIKYF